MTALLSRKAPSLFWTMVEGRAIFEFNSFYAMRPLMKKLPKGDGHPVIIFPGFVASDSSTKPMRSLFKDLGYKTYGWGLGRNLKFDAKLETDMLALLDRVYKKHGRKVSLIGWSLGGIFAREIAKKNPDAVRSVITLGSPISGDNEHSNAHHLYDFLNGAPTKAMADRMAKMNEAPPVPTTSIYSKTDGIVAWKGSVQNPGEQTENISVPASHTGLGVNPIVMYAIADRLAQPEGQWIPFDRSGMRGLFFGKQVS